MPRRHLETTLLMSPRIAVGEDVAADMRRIRAGGRPVVITDGQQALVAVVPIELFRELIAVVSGDEHRPHATPPVLEPDELDALLADWDVSQPPAPLLPPSDGRSVRDSEPPRPPAPVREAAGARNTGPIEPIVPPRRDDGDSERDGGWRARRRGPE
ncbi:MAG: hypothetical protein R3F65_02485 [bacterium]|nr:hypothetical protein [Myxococcales bacterium]